MHYYQFNIGDYMSHTKGLTIFEDLAYRRMLDEYYLHESPLPLSVSEIARRICLPEKHEEVIYVLSKFFVETDKGYVNARAQKEIKKYKSNQKKKSEAGKLSGKVRRNKALGVEQSLNTCLTNDELNINHKPITNKQEPVNKKHITTSRAAALDYSCWPTIPSDQVFTDWLDMRKRLKANISQTVINNFASELKIAEQAGFSVDECLSECVTRNWRGFKFDWMREKQNATHQRASRETLSERANRAADEAFGTGSQSRVLEGCFDILNDNGIDQLTGSGGLPDLGQRSG